MEHLATIIHPARSFCTEDRLYDLQLLEAAGDAQGASTKPIIPRAQDADIDDPDDDDDDDDDDDEVRSAITCLSVLLLCTYCTCVTMHQHLSAMHTVHTVCTCASIYHHHWMPHQDEEAELLAELERIKAERAEKEAKERAAAAEEEAATRQEELVGGNPLLHLGVRLWVDGVP